MDKQTKLFIRPQNMKSLVRNKAVHDFITKLEKCLLQYKKHLVRRTVLRLGKYIKGNTFHIKILQLAKVRQYKHMVSFFREQNYAANKSISNDQFNITKSSKIDHIERGIASRIENLRKRRKTLEDKENHQKWDAERKLEEQARMEPCTSRAALAKDQKSKDEAVSLNSNPLPSSSTALCRSRSFFDKLLSKINRSNSSSAEDITKESNKDDETSSCSSSMGFLGFNENDAVTFNSNQYCDSLSDNLENKSAFISEELEEFLKENALENCSNITVPTVKFQYEEGMVHSGSEMPTMEEPKQLVKRKARTVAEKRQILESKKDVKYLMVENESTIYWELQRRLKKSKNFNFDLITSIQNQDIPIRRGVWKTASWLATRSGKFYFQSIEIENKIKNERINLYGGHGNYDSKLIRLRKFEFKKYNSIHKCNVGCNILKLYPNLKIDLLDVREKSENDEGTKPHETISRLNLISNQRHLKPGPLSSKIKYDRSGELQIFEMPKIQLEVNPRPGYEFATGIKKYLNLILPSDNITEEWAKFAVSAVVGAPVVKKRGPKSKTKQPFTYIFDVPYADNQNKVLTRKELIKRVFTPAIYTSGVENEMNSLEKPLEVLPKCINRDDIVQSEIGDYLNDMYNSAVIGLCQNSIVKNDPDLNYNRKDGLQSQLKGKRISNFHDKKVRKNKSKLLNELRRLNATFIETADAGENHECNEEHCTLGCVCSDIRKIPPIHCRKEKCMFECTCKKLEERAYIQRNAIVEDGLSEEDMKLLRDRATCRLAKMEKDFSSTIVLTNDNTILIHNTQVESKRNRKPSKILKGYSTDDLDKDNEKTIATPPRPTPPEKENLNKYKSIEYMTHCNVVLDKLPELDLEVWCNVHCLYKCFCNATATKGDVFGFTDISAKNSQHFPPAPAKRRNYTFDKTDTVQSKVPSLKPSPSNTAKASSTGLSVRTSTSGTGPRASKVLNKSTTSESDEPNIRTILSRCEVVDYEYYRLKNKAARRKILKYANAEAKLHSLLKQRVNDCLYSKRLNQFNKVNNVVIVLSESEDDKGDDEVEEISTNYATNEEKEMDCENIQSIEPIEEDEPKDPLDISDQNAVEIENLPNDENDRSTTPEPDLSKFTTPESPASNNPFNNRIPVDKFIQFSNQIDNGIINSPSRTNVPIKSENVTKLNLIVTKAMSRLCEMQKNNLNDIPDPKLKGFNNISWDNLIKIYRDNKIFIWEVRRVTKSSNLNLLLAVTKTCTMPKIECAVSVVCVKAVRPDELSVTGKMINLQIMNEKTKNLAVIIYGQQDHWLILGCIHSDVNYLEDGVCVRPTPATHPLLATKINRLNTLLCNNPFILQNRNTRTTPIVPLKLSELPRPSTEVSKSSHIHKTNIEVVPFSLNGTDSLFLPIPVIGDHRWFMLTIEHDFSDIYIPTWHSFLKYERIVATHKIARSRSKTVRILHMNNEHTVPHVFITPKESNKIFFGPYRVDQDVSMVLCQECDGKMLSREIYEDQTKIIRGKRTTGCWLYVKNNEIVPDKLNQSAAVLKVENAVPDDDVIFLDEVDTINNKNDCILIEDDDDDQIDPPSQPISPLAGNGKKILLRARTPPSVGEHKKLVKLQSDDEKEKIDFNKPVSDDEIQESIIMKSVSEEKMLVKSVCDENKNLELKAMATTTTTTTTNDITKFSLIPGTKRSKVVSILKPVTSKKSAMDSPEIVFNQVKPGQTMAMAMAASSKKPINISPPACPKQISVLKNNVNGTMFKLKPITQLGITSKLISLSPPPSPEEIIPTTPLTFALRQPSTPTPPSKQPTPPPKQLLPLLKVPTSPSKQLGLIPKPPTPPSKQPTPPPNQPTNPSKQPTPPLKQTNSPPKQPTPPLTQVIPPLKPLKQITSLTTPPLKQTSPPASTETSQVPVQSKNDNKDEISSEQKVDSLVTICNDNVVIKPPPSDNTRRALDTSTILNRMIYNPGSNSNTVLGKRKFTVFPDPMKKPLLNSNLKVFKKQTSDSTGSAGSPAQEEIKILLKRKKSIQHDEQKFTKLRIIEDPKPLTEKSTDAVTKALQKLSATSTYIRNNTTSTVTSATVTTSVTAPTTPTATSPVQITPMVASTSNTNVQSKIKVFPGPRMSLDSKLADINLDDSRQSKIITVVDDDDDPRLTIKGYIVSECTNLGKIPCEINKLNISFRLPTMDAPVTLLGTASLNTFLHRKLREAVHSIIPNDLNMKFSIITNRKKMVEIPDLSIDMLNKNKVLTEFGLIDLRINFENDTLLKSNPVLMVRLLILQLDRLLNEKSNGQATKNTAYQILQKTQTYVKQLKSEEALLMKTKLSLYKEIYHKKNALSKLTEQDEIIIPDTDPDPSPPAEALPPSKLLFLHYGQSSMNHNNNNTEKVNSISTFSMADIIGPGHSKIDSAEPLETIVIDDDED